MIERCQRCERRKFGGTLEENGAEYRRRYDRPGIHSTCLASGDMECDEVTAAIETLQRAGLWLDQRAALDRIDELRGEVRFEQELAKSEMMGADY